MLYMLKDKKTGGNAVLLPVLIILCGLVLALLMYSGPFVGYDDVAYLAYAHEILIGTFHLTQSTYTYGFLFPLTIAFSFLAFGANIYSASLPGIIEYVAIMAFTFLIAKKLYDTKLATISLLFVASAPFIVAYATRVVPDMLQGAIACFSIYIFVANAQSQKQKPMLYFVAGAVSMLAVYAQLLSVLFVFFFACAVIFLSFSAESPKKEVHAMLRLSRASALFFISGIFVMAIIYLLIFYWQSGSPLYLLHYSQFQSSGTVGILYNIVEFISITYGYGLPGIGHTATSVTGGEVPPIGPMALWAIAGLIIGFKKRDRPAMMNAIIGIGFMLYLFFGTISLSSYSTATVVTRYLMVVAAPLSILAAFAVSDISHAFTIVFSDRIGMMVLCVFIIITLGFNASVMLTLYQYNASIYSATKVFSEVMGNVTAGSAVHPARVWVADPLPISLLLYEYGVPTVETYLQFLTGYNSSITVNYTEGNHCDGSIPGQYLITLYKGNVTNTTVLTENWLGSNCTISNIANYSNPEVGLWSVSGK